MALLRVCVIASLVLASACTKLRSVDERRDGAVGPFDSDIDCDRVPVIADVSPAVLAHGARIVVYGGCLDRTTSVTLDGMSLAFTVEGDEVVIDEVPDAVGTGTGLPLVLSSQNGESEALGVTVAHLVVSEIDAASGHGNDDREFVELATGIPARASLAGYSVVFLGGAMPGTYAGMPGFALGTTSPTGRYIIGNHVKGVQQEIGNASLGEGMGAHVVAIVQADSPPDASTPLGQLGLRVLDAIVYGTGGMPASAMLLDWSFATPPGRVSMDEASGGDAAGDSIQRCGDARRDGRSFTLAKATPDEANTCP